jgi:hypothetical protein
VDAIELDAHLVTAWNWMYIGLAWYTGTVDPYSRRLQRFLNDRMTLAVGTGDCTFETCIGLVSYLGSFQNRIDAVEEMRRDGVDAHMVDDALVAVIGNEIAAMIAEQHGSPEIADTLRDIERSWGGMITHEAMHGAKLQRVLIVRDDIPPMLLSVKVQERTSAKRRS